MVKKIDATNWQPCAEVLEAWPDEDRRTRIVMITRDLDAALLQACFARFDMRAEIA